MATKTKKPAPKRSAKKGQKHASNMLQEGSSDQIPTTRKVQVLNGIHLTPEEEKSLEEKGVRLGEKEPGYEQEIGQAKLFLMSLREPVYAQTCRFTENKVMYGSAELMKELQFGPTTEDKLRYLKALSDLVARGHEMLRLRRLDRVKIDDAAKSLANVLRGPTDNIDQGVAGAGASGRAR